MQINVDFYCSKTSPQFGMAFRIPDTKGIEKLNNYARLATSEVRQRGMEQFIKEQGKLKFFDTSYDPKFDTMYVIDNRTNEKIESFIQTPAITGYSDFDATRYPGRKMLAIMFNPKKFLPLNMLQAGERAKELEKTLLASAPDLNKINKVC